MSNSYIDSLKLSTSQVKALRYEEQDNIFQGDKEARCKVQFYIAPSVVFKDKRPAVYSKVAFPAGGNSAKVLAETHIEEVNFSPAFSREYPVLSEEDHFSLEVFNKHVEEIREYINNCDGTLTEKSMTSPEIYSGAFAKFVAKLNGVIEGKIISVEDKLAAAEKEKEELNAKLRKLQKEYADKQELKANKKAKEVSQEVAA